MFNITQLPLRQALISQLNTIQTDLDNQEKILEEEYRKLADSVVIAAIKDRMIDEVGNINFHDAWRGGSDLTMAITQYNALKLKLEAAQALTNMDERELKQYFSTLSESPITDPVKPKPNYLKLNQVNNV